MNLVSKPKSISYWQMGSTSIQHRLYDYLWVCTDTTGIGMMICRYTYPDDCCCQARYLITICQTVWSISRLLGLLSRQLKSYQQGRMHNISQLMKHAAIPNKAQQYGLPYKRQKFQDLSNEMSDMSKPCMTLQWHHNGHDCTSNHQPHDCLLKPFIQKQIKENIKALSHWFWVGNSQMTSEFPAQMSSNEEKVSIWWRHHELYSSTRFSTFQGRMLTCEISHLCFTDITAGRLWWHL